MHKIETDWIGSSSTPTRLSSIQVQTTVCDIANLCINAKENAKENGIKWKKTSHKIVKLP